MREFRRNSKQSPKFEFTKQLNLKICISKFFIKSNLNLRIYIAIS
ncbi:hypothetical protein [Campylobacter sp. CS_ED2]|nr:hypothetical protein [Campylobacter sp. CS_ED2]